MGKFYLVFVLFLSMVMFTIFSKNIDHQDISEFDISEFLDYRHVGIVLSRLKSLSEGDTLIFTSLDRLARSTRHLLQMVEDMDRHGVMIKSLSQLWADTTTPEGRLMITVFAGLAEFERGLIVERTSRGRTAALKRGVKFGRKPILDKYQQGEALKMLQEGRRGVEVSRLFGVSEATISRLRKTYTV